MPSGILVVDKPAGVTSHDVCGFVRKLAGGVKTGHSGTLDPAATGVLVLCAGSATRLAEYLCASTKEYVATVLLDRRTTTGDLDGKVEQLFEIAQDQAPSPARLERALEGFRGEILQKPHRVSAVKVGGRRLYERARAGELPDDIPARKVRISRLEVLSYGFPGLKLSIECSSGTYVRQLAEDLGAALGLGGCLQDLVRTRVGAARLEAARTPFELASLAVHGGLEAVLEPPSGYLPDLGTARAGQRLVSRIGHGGWLNPSDLESYEPSGSSPLVKVLAPAGELVAIYRVEGGRLEPCKILI